MKADVYFAAAEVDPQSLAEKAVVVIDALRATTTIVEALANGGQIYSAQPLADYRRKEPT